MHLKNKMNDKYCRAEYYPPAVASTTFILFCDFEKDDKEEQNFFSELLRLDINICLFVFGSPDKVYFSVEKRNIRARLVVLYATHNVPFFASSILHKMIDEDFLPKNRNKNKDTFDYILKSHQKYEFVSECIESNPFQTSHFIWIDISIFRMFYKPDETISYLEWISKNINLERPFITFPGCQQNKIEDDAILLDNVVWRFCGAFFLGDKLSVANFCEIYKRNIIAFIEKYEKMVWDFNFLAWLEKNASFEIFWYRADHNDSIIRVSGDIFSKKLKIEKGIIYDYPKIETYYPTSASFLSIRGERWLNTRFVNYWIYPNGCYHFHNGQRLIENKNILSKLDENYNAISFVEMDERPLRENIKESTATLSVGLEDIRLYFFGGKVKYCATTIGYSDNGRSKIICGDYDLEKNEIAKNGEIILSPDGQENAYEKNWIPFIGRLVDDTTEREYFIYKWHPLEIGVVEQTESGKKQLNIVIRHETPCHFFHNARGSSCLLQIETEEYICVVHSSEEHSPRHYYHFLVVLDKTLKPIRKSKPFFFEKLGVEFCIGMDYVRDKKEFVFWISRHDRDPICLFIEEEKIFW